MKANFTGAKFNVLTNYGYTYSMTEGGWISADGATVISEIRKPYERQIMQFKPDAEEAHEKNVNKLVSFGLAEIVAPKESAKT